MLRALLSHGPALLAAALALTGAAQAETPTGAPAKASASTPEVFDFQEQSPEEPAALEPADAPEVVVAAPGETAAPRVPTGAADRLDARDAAVALTELGDLLEAAVGAHVRHSGGVGRAQFLQIRGAGAHQIAVLLDDVPLDGGRGSAFDLSTLPAALVAEAEVLRGAAAAAYGGGAQGGVLRLRTAPPGGGHRDSVAQGAARGAAEGGHLTDVRLRLGSTALAQVDATHARGDAQRGLRVSLSGSRAEGDFPFVDVNGNRRRRENHHHRRVGGLLSAHDHLGGLGHFGVLLEGVALARGEPGIEQFRRPEDESAQHRVQAALTWRRPAVSVPVETAALVWGRQRGYDFAAPDPLYDGPPYAALDDLSLGGRAEVAWSPADHRLSLAADVRGEWAETRADTLTGAPPARRDEQRRSHALTLAEVWRPVAALTALGTLRLDDTDRRAAAWLPQAGLAWRALPGLVVRGNVGRLFRDPGLDELYFEGPGVRGDPDLRPEDGLGYDLGVEWITAHLGLEVTAFVQRHDRLIVFAPLDAWRIRARDDFAAEVRGLEAAARLWLGPLEGRVTYTALDARETTGPGFALPYRPPHRVFAALTAHLPGGAELYGRVDTRAATYTDRFEGRRLAGYTLVDLGLRGPLPAEAVGVPGLALGFEVRNLLDAQGLDLAQQPRPGRTVLLSLGFSHGGL